MSKLNIVLAGHSHLIAMGVSASSREQPPKLVDVPYDGPAHIVGLSSGGIAKNKGSYWDLLLEVVQDKIVLLSWKGNQHNEAWLFRQRPDFDFVLPGHPASLLDDATIVPISVVRKFLAPSLAELPKLIADLRARGGRDVILVGTAPPKGDDAEMLARLSKSSYYRQWAEQRGVDISTTECLTPLPVRQKGWQLLQLMVREIAEKTGAPFVAVPGDTLEPDGTLARPYWSGDVSHGNPTFGKRLLDEAVAAAVKLERCEA